MDLIKKGFQLPENVEFDAESLTNAYGKFYAEAFERGFGTTIGNSLRRVLLSSIEGAAVTSIRIPGVLHEFTSIPKVKEDIVDIVLNIKQLAVKLHSDAPKVISVNISGSAEVTGKDFDTGAQVEILTPDLHIATLDKKASFKMELTVEKGKGYTPAEGNKKDDQTVDTIAVDSIFSPIKKVNFWVENARVGRSTDYDRLIMEIWTNGSITPKQALSQAANILKGHISLFSDDKEDPVVEEEVVVETEGIDEGGEPYFNDNLLKSVDELELSVRSSNCLKNADIRTIADLVQRTEPEMLRTKNFGRKSLNEIKEVLTSMGLYCNMRIDTVALEEAIAAKGKKDAS